MVEGRGRKRSEKVRLMGESVAEYVAPSSVLKTALHVCMVVLRAIQNVGSMYM